jgi:tRNA threonylcarbamoyladenosine biosynthesis protein TsaB
MRILLIDTCGPTGSVALADTTAAPPQIALELMPGRTFSERLVPSIRTLLASGAPLDVIAVVHGPGSFTGVRVGVSAAKGLCEALAVPLTAISRLAVLAALAGDAGDLVCAVMDAGRGEFYLGEYVGARCLREGLMSREELLATVASSKCRLVTSEALIASALAELRPIQVPEPTAADALPLALTRIAHAAFDDPATLDANYLRRTDAQIFAKPKAAAAVASGT